MNRRKISIVDYGLGNIASVVNMIRHVGGEAEIISDPSRLDRPEKLLLPGVGAFDHAIRSLADGGWIKTLNDAVLNRRVPVLGICLGMQLMCKTSEEGASAGLGWIDATVHRFNFNSDNQSLKVPHMGWNVVVTTRPDALVSGVVEKQRFYFVHSYYVRCNSHDDVFLMAKHGIEFVAGFQRDNIWGVQFHPEKSHKFGMALLRKFIEV